jgi:hypothetical protein
MSTFLGYRLRNMMTNEGILGLAQPESLSLIMSISPTNTTNKSPQVSLGAS